MKCPYCGQEGSRVVDSRELPERVRRRRECTACGRRFTTYERIETVELVVVKRDGRREDFDRQKLLRSVRNACHKRPVPVAQIEKLVGEVEGTLLKRGVTEVPSRLIGDLVMERLKAVDEIAYVRFASIYRQFADLETLADEVAGVQEWKRRREETRSQIPLL